jgi:GNAT superfamily N-acetyltransferase
MKLKITDKDGVHFHYFYAFNQNGEEIGCAGVEKDNTMHYSFKELCNETPDRCAKIIYVKVVKSHRRQGAATAILSQVTETYKDWDLFLNVSPLDMDNTVQTLTKFYEKFGFKRCESFGSVPTMIKPATL